MSINDRDMKRLWAKAGNVCSYMYGEVVCNKKLIVGDNGKDVVFGKVCHIVDRNPKTSRFIQDYPDVDKYENLILLCGEHHDLIDSNGDKFSVTVLKKMRESHEKSIAEKLKESESKPILIENTSVKTDVKNADEVIGMEVNRPAQLKNVNVELKAENVKRAVGFSTNQGMSVFSITCPSCNGSLQAVFTGSPPEYSTCGRCGAKVKLNDRS